MQHREGCSRDLIEQRVTALAGFYARVAEPTVSFDYWGQTRLFAGSISFTEEPDEAGDVLVWGEPLPSSLRSAQAILTAGDNRLREIAGQTLAVAPGERQARIVTGAGLVASAYVAEGSESTAWASHAVAAAFLATGRATFDQDRLPELIARNFVGGGRTLIKESSVLPVATVVDIDGSKASTRTFWSGAERWAPVPSQDAQELAEEALCATLIQRTQDFDVNVGLTAGLDSTVVGLALSDLGLPFRTFTWGTERAPDLDAARRTSQILGVEHQRLDPVEPEPEEAIEFILGAVRWTEGIGAASVVERRWPTGRTVAVMGVGGEIGRAFYYTAGLAKAFPEPSPRQVIRFFDAGKAIAGADRRARRLLREAETAWVAEALEDGVSGWRCLDHVYAEQRVRNWGRGMTPRLGTPVVAAFATSEVARGLSSLTQRLRTEDGFHRAVLARRAELARPGEAAPMAGGLRSAAANLPGARFVAHRIRRLKRERDERQWGGREVWTRHSEARRWVCQAIESEPVLETMGRSWVDRAIRGFTNDLHHETEMALQCAGAVAFRSALEELPTMTRRA